MINFLSNLDGNILLWIQEFIRNSICTPIFVTITHLGDGGAIWIIISIALLFHKKTRKMGILCIISLLGSLIVNNLILKNLVARVRPYEVVDGLKLIIEKQVDLSFPSGHTGASFAAAVTIYQCAKNKKYGILAIIFASLIAFSRLYVGVHYPTDVITALFTGTFISIFVVKLNTKYKILDKFNLV